MELFSSENPAREIVKRYCEILDNSTILSIESLFTDSLLIKVTQYEYEQTFSQKEYEEWLKWDFVFRQTFELNGKTSPRTQGIDPRPGNEWRNELLMSYKSL